MNKKRNRGRILLVDDSATTIDLVKSALENGGYEVNTAASGVKALERVEDNEPNLILLDIMMEGVDGYETCRRLKANPRTREIPVIFLSGLGAAFDKVKGFKLGAVDYVVKPIEMKELLSRVETHVTIKRLQKNLEQANAGLEERVRLRTRALQKSNEKLLKEIRERRRAEEEMSRLRNLLSNIINCMPSVLVGVDLEERVTQWNREAEKTTGVAAQDALGRDLADVHPYLAAKRDKIEQAIREARVVKEEKAPIDINGETRCFDVTVYPLVGEALEGAVIRVDDVTERVRIDEMMIQTEKIMSVGGLAAGMAHEINSPLGGILQCEQNMSLRVSPMLRKNIKAARECGVELEAVRGYLKKRDIFHFLDMIRESAVRATRIVSNMLRFSRQSESQKSSGSLSGIIDGALELALNDFDLKKGYDFRNIKIEREYEPDFPGVPCVEMEICQVVLNLLKNAAHAMAERDEGADAPKIIIQVLRDDPWARIEVEDNGPGMADEVRERIFKPFFTTKEEGKGTGLGLSVSHFIITHNHGGFMTVESTRGLGTKFIIKLPLGEEGEK
ncbi:MAG: response regulator [Desulfobacterales bacterium]|nr:response regulator [Desulfobacterales bacterium]